MMVICIKKHLATLEAQFMKKLSNTLREESVFGVILVRIQYECGKIRTRITPNTGTFYTVTLRLNGT